MRKSEERSLPADATNLQIEQLVNEAIMNAHATLAGETDISVFEVRARIDGGEFVVWWFADDSIPADTKTLVRHPHNEAKRIRATGTEPEHLLVARLLAWRKS